MHVAFVSMRTAQHAETGATERTRRVSEALAARGHDVTVCCAKWWDGELAEFDQNGVRYRAVTEEPAPGKFGSRLPIHLLKEKPAVIQAVNSPPGHVLAARRAGRFLRSPVVVDWWADRPEDDWVGYKRAVLAASQVFAPSELIRTQVREHGADDDCVSILPESIDLDLVSDSKVDRRADLVYANDLDADCNVESFLLALAELRTRTWRAAVIGDGPLRAQAEQTARELRIDDRVAFLGDLPPEEFVPVLKGAHVFAQTASREPFATELLWALACGCVGLVEYQAGSSAHELVSGGNRRGRRVTSPQELATAIADVADRPHRTQSDGYERYDHDAVLDRYLEQYRKATDEYGFSFGFL